MDGCVRQLVFVPSIRSLEVGDILISIMQSWNLRKLGLLVDHRDPSFDPGSFCLYDARDVGVRTRQCLPFQELEIVEAPSLWGDLVEARVAARLGILGVDHGNESGLQNEQLMSTSDISERFPQLEEIDVPADVGHAVE